MTHYEFVYEEIPDLRILRKVGSVICEGTLARDGSFVPDLSTLPSWNGVPRLRNGPVIFSLPLGYKPLEAVYEYQSGLLIPMLFDSKMRVIPEVGGVVIDFRKYYYTPNARKIYNLPSRFVLRVKSSPTEIHARTNQARSIGSTINNKSTVKARVHTPISKANRQDTKFVFQLMTNIRYRHHLGQWPVLGNLDEHGQFIPDLTTLNVKPVIGGPNELVEAREPNEPVYEFRYGLLVPMIIHSNLGLIPEIGGKIIDFKDYKYSPTARRIYNLPGKFVEK